MRLQRDIQTKLKQATGFIAVYISDIVNRKIHFVSWSTAKMFAAVTNTTPYLWLEGTSDGIQAALNNFLTVNHE